MVIFVTFLHLLVDSYTLHHIFEFESHWVPLSYGLVPHLSKKFSKFPLSTTSSPFDSDYQRFYDNKEGEIYCNYLFQVGAQFHIGQTFFFFSSMFFIHNVSAIYSPAFWLLTIKP